MKTQTFLSLLIIVLGLSTTAVRSQDNTNNTNPFLRTTAQTDEQLNAPFTDHANIKPANRLTDPGPVWQGLTDTTAFNERIKAHIYRADLKIDRLKKQLKGQRLIEPVEHKALQYLSAERELENARLLARIVLNAHPEKTFRDVAQRWDSRLSKKLGQLNTDPEVYYYLAEIDSSELSPELRYIRDKKLTIFERNGVLLGKEEREQVAELKYKITTFGNQFERNIFENTPTLTIHRDSLSGISTEWIESHPQDEQGFVRIPLTNPNMNQLAIYAEQEYARQAAMKGYYTKGYPLNFSVLDSLRTARHTLARLLGYESWAHYSAEPLMTKSPRRIQQFLSQIATISKEPIENEINQLLQIKKETDPTAEEIDWVISRYLQNKVMSKNYNFSASKIKEYLSCEQVIDGVLTTSEKLYDIEIRHAPQLPKWSPAVEPYEIVDHGNLIGRIYLDMHPRKGKFGGAGNFTLRMGNSTVPETTLLMNLPGGTPDDPGLLDPGQVRVIFHEFGHALHRIFTGSAPAVGKMEWDFIEAPSRLFEEWAKDPKNLSRFARHYETGEPIPNKMVKAYNQSDQFGRALRTHYSLWPAVLSFQHFNSAPHEQSIKEVEDHTFESAFHFKRPDWFHPSSFLPHLFLYSSNFYTYLWSDVIAQDLLTRFDNKNLLNPDVGHRYRKIILERSGTAPMEELIEEFLGRPFNTEAWQDWLNGSQKRTITQTER
ncbi:M3 family metallopeptidase [Fodinibius sediminis]|uniref:Thimet oligopeptidase n=1 Tax=Fodinibius sediminis TaxID=1214077 RepID=A0A521DCG5_9BACT|nr:M3 family metallopeptidase [Fodinibius sediminis]SMO69373.1 thimet oligopeptidase [Fodinibius sediminis]